MCDGTLLYHRRMVTDFLIFLVWLRTCYLINDHTQDVTRTWHFGEATDAFKDAYTRVLKGHIGLDTMIFPENTPGFVLDVLARQHLWQACMDYGMW